MIKKSQGLSQGRLTDLRPAMGRSPPLSPGTSSEGAWALGAFARGLNRPRPGTSGPGGIGVTRGV
jgi:hypothetical protein